MNKKELVVEIQKKTNLSKKEVEVVVNAFTDVVRNELGNSGRVRLLGFGSFDVKRREERAVRNPNTGESIKVEAHNVPVFRAGKELKAIVR